MVCLAVLAFAGPHDEVFANPPSATISWGIAEDVLIATGDNVVESTAELGWNSYGYNSLTITGGYLEVDRIYSGGGENPANVTIDVSGGELNISITSLAYTSGTTTTVNMSGGIWNNDSGLFSVARYGDTTFNMSGGTLNILGAYLYMPGSGTVSGRGYSNPSNGTFNYSGGLITIDEDWSAANGNILGQVWFNDLTGTATATWDGSVTLVSSGPRIIMTESGGTEVAEGGASDTYEIKLSIEPSANVTVAAAPNDSEISVGAGPGAAKNLLFTPSNWNTAQTVTISAVDDTAYEGGPNGTPHITTIAHTAQQPAGDGEYDGISGDDLQVRVIDDELGCGDWDYDPADFNQDCYVNLADFAEFSLNFLADN